MPRARSGAPKDRKTNRDLSIKRERSLRACTRCRQRKQKCDNTLPHCSNCVKGGVLCEAFPINVVSRDNLLQVYDLLQESTRRNNMLEKELSLARIVVPDFLAVFSARIARKVTEGLHRSDSSRQSVEASSISDSNIMLLPSAEPLVEHVVATPDAAATSMAVAYSRSSEPKSDIWATIKVLDDCFPAVAHAVSIVAKQLDQDLSLSNLVDIAAVPMRDLHLLLTGTTTLPPEGGSGRSLIEPGTSLQELLSRVLGTSEITRIAATLLWALLALVQHRGEELTRLDTALTCFVQAWQVSNLGSFDTKNVVTLSFCRAYEWVHLQTAIMTGKLLVLVTTMTCVQDASVTESGSNFTHFLASLHVEQKRLEYVALHLFISPPGAMTDDQHQEAVWCLLGRIKTLSDIQNQGFETFGVPHNSSVTSPRVLMRHKLGALLYGTFPRILFMHCPDERRRWRWLNNALSLTATALGYHHAAWQQYNWLSDHVVDALTFSDLLAAFAYTLQQRATQHDTRDEAYYHTYHLYIGIELGERFAERWPQYSDIFRPTLTKLYQVRDSPLSPSGFSTPWSSTSVATAPTESTVLRTPQAHEMPQQSTAHTQTSQNQVHAQQYFQADPTQPDLRQQFLQPPPCANDSLQPPEYLRPDVNHDQAVTEEWQATQMQTTNSDWSGFRGDTSLVFSSVGHITSSSGAGQQLPFVPLNHRGTVERKDEASTSDSGTHLRNLPPITTALQLPSPTNKTFVYLDARATDATPHGNL